MVGRRSWGSATWQFPAEYLGNHACAVKILKTKLTKLVNRRSRSRAITKSLFGQVIGLSLMRHGLLQRLLPGSGTTGQLEDACHLLMREALRAALEDPWDIHAVQNKNSLGHFLDGDVRDE